MAKRDQLREEVSQLRIPAGPTRLFTIQRRVGQMKPGHRTRIASALRAAQPARAQQ